MLKQTSHRSLPLASVAIFCSTFSLAPAASYIWDGGAATANWSDNGNWDLADTPDDNIDDVTIHSGGVVNTDFGGYERVRSLTVGSSGVGSLTVEKWRCP